MLAKFQPLVHGAEFFKEVLYKVDDVIVLRRDYHVGNISSVSIWLQDILVLKYEKALVNKHEIVDKMILNTLPEMYKLNFISNCMLKVCYIGLTNYHKVGHCTLMFKLKR